MTTPRPATAERLRAVRAQLRVVCDLHGVPVEQRGRLVLAVVLVIRAAGGGVPTVTTDARREPDGATTLEVSLRIDGATPPHPPNDLPLPAETDANGAVVWRLAVPDAAPLAHEDDTDLAADQELRAAIAHIDTVEREHRRLKHEMAETNSGVLAMYVQLEERDERLRRAHAVIFRELEDALRPPAPEVTGVEFGVHYQPAEAEAPTGGDLYDWFTLPDGSLHVTVIDAVGHGVECTRAAVTISHTIRTLAVDGHPLDALIRRTDEIAPHLMATVLLARLDPATGRLQLANGGHPPALLVPADGGAPAYLPLRGRGVGYPKPGSPEIREEHLRPGDTLLLYTDGLVESRGDYGEGELRLLAAADGHRAHPSTTLASAVVRAMQDVVHYRDDTLLLTLRYLGRR